MHADPSRGPLLLAAAVLAAAAPSLLAYNVSPSPTFLNQALALGCWGSFVMLQAAALPQRPGAAASAMAWPSQAALALLALAAAWSFTLGSLPSSLGWSALGLLAASALLVHAGAAARGSTEGDTAFAWFAGGWVVAGLLNLAIALVQVFAPGWPDGDWIAASNIVGRAVGNLRQPNHLSSVLLWAAICALALHEQRRLPRAAGAAIVAAMVFGVVLTASRTGLVSVGILALWGVLDRRLARDTRALLLATPVLYAISWVALAQWAEWSGHTFGGAARLAETDVSGSRFGIWANTLALIRQQPWTGVGFGEFNFAWSLTPFPGRPTAFFDHTHNLPLQLAVELGLPLAGLVLGLLLWGLARGAWRAARAEGNASVSDRAALMFVLMIGLHSLLEYPLWYAYFLLPTAWAFGFALGRAPHAAPLRPRLNGLGLAGTALALGAAVAVWDYGRVTVIFGAGEGAAPLEARIERGQKSLFFAHHADYAAATTDSDERLQRRAFDGAAHYLLDTRFTMAWAEWLAAQGQLDHARHLAARLREFRNPLSNDWFAECDAPPPPGGARPFQCEPPQRTLTWRDFQPRR
ncbi:MAG: O-antigen ligase C-terminal domain-containing protein [Rubrivivax sp.]|nr:O-antigen ligase C-terminal domain-containing protein [Rubrivivax sp.]